MAWQFTPVAILYLVAILTAAFVMFRTTRLYPARGTQFFMLLNASVLIWAFGYLLGQFSADIAVKEVMLRIEYIGILGTPLLWLLFALTYSYYERYVTPVSIAVLSLLPVTTWFLVLFVDQHQLFYQSYEFVTQNGLLIRDKIYGPFFYASAGYAYLTVLAGSVILILSVARRRASMYRGQGVLLVIGSLVPLIFNIIYVANNEIFGLYDPTPLTFVVTAVALFIAMERFRLMELVPVAHHLVVRTLGEGVIAADADGRILEMNPAAEAVFGKSLADLLGHNIGEVFAPYAALLQTTTKNGFVRAEVGYGQNKRILNVEMSVMRNRQDDIAGRVLVLRDITQRKQTETERERLIADLDAYAHTVAHDLKGPLTVVMTAAGLMGEDLEEEEMEGSRRLIARTAEKMTNIIGDLLLLSSVRDSEDTEIEPLDMQRVVAESVALLNYTMTGRGARLEMPEQWPPALGYAPWVEGMWSNYITNAIKYGGRPPVITLGAEPMDEGKVKFWVRDNGPGIPPEKVPLLFRQHTQLRGRGAEGHGLGLSIVRRIAEKLGGEVGVESEVGKGSTFYFTLPAAEEPDTAADNKKVAETDNKTQTDTGTASVKVLEATESSKE